MNILVLCDHDELGMFIDIRLRKISNNGIRVESSSYLDIVTDNKSWLDVYDVVWSVHCKKLFPKWLTDSKRCLNMHPGFSPFNRGYAPNVFSIINGYPVGVTVHKIDQTIDNGPIIYQEEIKIEDIDTSGTVYRRIIDREKELLISHFDKWSDEAAICPIKQDIMVKRGNINSEKDFENLCQLDLDSVGTLGDHIRLLRSLTDIRYDNAFYMSDEGVKIFISVKLKTE